MKKVGLTMLFAGWFWLPAQAQFFGPEAWSGALFGGFIGGVAGADCHAPFSGKGAAIGAGVGFLAGALVGAANREYYSAVAHAPPPYPHSQVGYGYVYAPASVISQSQVAPPIAPIPTTSVWSAAKAPPAAQIPDAPRIPDAPTF